MTITQILFMIVACGVIWCCHTPQVSPIEKPKTSMFTAILDTNYGYERLELYRHELYYNEIWIADSEIGLYDPRNSHRAACGDTLVVRTHGWPEVWVRMRFSHVNEILKLR